ncbi:MAG: hypothetical protein ABIO70_35005 [Pseudomonadota bacterium]
MSDLRPPPRPAVVALLVGALPAAFLLAHLGLPLVEDSLFWWVPRALWLTEHGPAWVAAGDLPRACLTGGALPPQWSGGLPDYGHPPLWFHYLAGWLALLGPYAWALRLACLPPAALLGWSAVALARRIGGPAASPLALLVLAAPPVLAQVLRPDTDLPLLALSLTALVALADGRPWRFALLAALAAWIKEPAVLLTVPAAVLGLRDRRMLAAAAAGPAALALWVTIHRAATGWALAGAERLPPSLGAWLGDLAAVLHLTFAATGRWIAPLLLLAGLAAARARPTMPPSPPGHATARRTALILAVFAAAQIAVFSVLNFLGGRDVAQGYTHVRYLLPGAAAALLLLGGLGGRALLRALPVLGAHPLRAWALLGLLTVAVALPGSHRLHPRGPEATLFGRDQALAWVQAAAALPALRPPEGSIWVESHVYTALTQPWAGLVPDALEGLRPSSPDLLPDELHPGDLLVHCSYGEPLGRLGELSLDPVVRFDVHQAWVRVDRVLPGRAAPPPSSAR